LEGEHTPQLFFESKSVLSQPDISPDGHWIAYASNESGTNEVYVQRYPGAGERIRISTDGGTEPIWTANGREILYRSFKPGGGGGAFVSVAIRSLSPFVAGAPRVLFEHKGGEYDSTSPTRSWDVTGDGQRFLLSKAIPPPDKLVTTMNVVLNWTEELKRRAP
jgi:hypothetical protein